MHAVDSCKSSCFEELVEVIVRGGDWPELHGVAGLLAKSESPPIPLHFPDLDVSLVR